MRHVLAAALAVIASAILTSATAEDRSTLAPADRVKSIPKGELKTPLTETPEVIEEGKALYQAKTCGACHGGNGGGIHCPSLINDVWIYGSDDDTLFRIITLGSEKMASEGYVRGDQEKHAGPMPGFGEAIADEQEVWKIVAYIRSLKLGREDAKQ